MNSTSGLTLSQVELKDRTREKAAVWQTGKFLTCFPVFITWRCLPCAHSIHLLSLEARGLIHFRKRENSVTSSQSCFRGIKCFGSSCKTSFGFRGNPAQCKQVRYTQEPGIDLNQSTSNLLFSMNRKRICPWNFAAGMLE